VSIFCAGIVEGNDRHENMIAAGRNMQKHENMKIIHFLHRPTKIISKPIVFLNN
jgi:hypothetical protein